MNSPPCLLMNNEMKSNCSLDTTCSPELLFLQKFQVVLRVQNMIFILDINSQYYPLMQYRRQCLFLVNFHVVLSLRLRSIPFFYSLWMLQKIETILPKTTHGQDKTIVQNKTKIAFSAFPSFVCLTVILEASPSFLKRIVYGVQIQGTG